jgi:decaprenyl-phosphate phosphoribosyltransferase
VALALVGAFVSFCLVSSATYLVNDVRDRDSDRRHPRKRLRPVAAGLVTPVAALRAAAALALLALIVAWLVRPELTAVLAGYACLTLSYTLWWRNIVLLDIVAVAGGFVLRAVAGGVAVHVSLSHLFLTVTSACAVFLVAGKRHAELMSAAPGARLRPVLRRYTRRGLRLLLAASAGLGLVAYTGWALGRPGGWLPLSVIPFGLWLGRYGALVRSGAGEAPEELVLHDGGLMSVGLLWALCFVAGVYGSA